MHKTTKNPKLNNLTQILDEFLLALMLTPELEPQDISSLKLKINKVLQSI